MPVKCLGFFVQTPCI